MSAPARPRPRPRPKAKPSGSSESTPTIAPTANPAETTSKTIITINKETLTASGKTITVPADSEGVTPEQADIVVPEDDDFDIFARRRTTIRDYRATTDERTVRPVGIDLSSSETDYSDEDGHGHRKKRKRSKASSPTWTRIGYGGKEDRIDEEPETGLHGDAGTEKGRRHPSARSPPAGKRDRQTTRSASRARSISLTPPPQIAPIIPMHNYRPTHAIHSILDDDDDLDLKSGYEWKPISSGVELGSKNADDANDDLAALIAKTRAKLAAETHKASATNTTGGRAGSAASASNEGGHFIDRGMMLQLTVTMRQDPMRAKIISERALKAYEKPRVFTIGSKCPLDPIYEKLAEVLDKEKEDIILTYGGERIWSTNFTPERLKIYTDEKLEGYEKDAWERTQQYHEAERLRKLREAELEIAERHALAARPTGDLDGGDHQEIEDDEIEVTAVHVARPTPDGRPASIPAPNTGKGTPAVAEDDDDDDAASPEDTSTILTLTLRGKEGDVKAKAKPTTKMSALVAYYRKVKKIETDMGIELDGEILEGDSNIADADLDDGDMLSVVPAR